MIYLLRGSLQPYAWGGYDYIRGLLGQARSAKPAAELWFGDHPRAPSVLEDHNGSHRLDTWLSAHAEAVLSPESRQRFGARLPFLLKILDVRLPLSIQLHPDKAQAEQGYARENTQGLSPDDARRNYKDDNHKPENMIALSPFWLLHGFADAALIARRLDSRPSLAPVARLIADKGIAAAYGEIMQADQTQLAAWLAPLLAQPAPQTPCDDPDYWLHYAVQAMAIDPQRLDAGLLSFYLFNIVHLQAGEGIFQAARLPHAYLRGQNIELMAASDNVLRAGLTPKHVDIPELLRIVDTAAVKPQIIAAPPPQQQGWYHYPAPVADYAFYSLHLQRGRRIELACPQAAVLLAVQGSLKIAEAGVTIGIGAAQAVLAGYGSRIMIEAEDDSYLVLATTL